VPTATAVSVQREPLSDQLWGELEPLLAANAHEIPHFLDDVPVAPSRAIYDRLAAADALRVYTARDEGRIIGYLAVIVSFSLHQPSATIATLDVLYVEPRHRGSNLGAVLLREAHRDLCAAGCRAMFQNIKADPRLTIAPLLRRLGYERVDELWAIRLDQEKNHG
jgi:GNAT superfamily N-acetyltransferase